MSAILTRVFLSLVVACLLAGRALRVALRRRPGNRQFGPWWTDSTLSSGNAGLYPRARAARFFPYALPVSEAVYFVAYTDSAGKPLRRGCTYCIHGRDLETRWWSIAAYEDNCLIPNSHNRYSFSKTTIQRRDDGTWTIRFSPREQSENWLPNASGAGQLKLVFRCYGPGQNLNSSDPAGLPTIEAGLCQNMSGSFGRC